MQHLVLYLEFDFHSRKGKSVNALFTVLIRWARVLLQHFFQCLPAVRRNFFQQLIRNFNGNKVLLRLFRKAAKCLRMAVHMRQIRFDVQNRRTVHQISSRHMQHTPPLLFPANVQQPHTGKSQSIGPKR